MVDAALEQLNALGNDENARVAFIAAESTWLDQLQTLLIERGVSFSVLRNTYTYQADHVLNVLAYLRLITDSRQDEEMARLLRKCLVPYLDSPQIKSLRDMARHEGVPLSAVAHDPEALAHARVSHGHRASLDVHLSIITSFTSESRVADIEKAIHAIPGNPIDALAEDEDKRSDIENILRKLRRLTAAQALAEVDRHIAFLDEHRGNTSFCLTTVDHAKSEEFDTVFLFGAQPLSNPNRRSDPRRDKRRLYVTISRARERLFLLYDGATGLHPVLQGIAPSLYQLQTGHPKSRLKLKRRPSIPCMTTSHSDASEAPSSSAQRCPDVGRLPVRQRALFRVSLIGSFTFTQTPPNLAWIAKFVCYSYSRQARRRHTMEYNGGKSMGATDSRLERVAAIERKLAASPRGYTTTELAAMYGVNPATIYRDLIMLQSMGVMLARKGRRYVLDGNRQLFRVKFTIDETLALYIAARLLSRHSDEHNPPFHQWAREFGMRAPARRGDSRVPGWFLATTRSSRYVRAVGHQCHQRYCSEMLLYVT